MATNWPDVYWDVSAMDRVRVNAAVSDSKGALWSNTTYFSIPEDIMEDLQDLLGDGNASVTVGNNVAVSDYGNKAECSVFVKLTCAQDLGSVERTREIGQALALRFVEDGLAQAEQILNKFLGKPAREADSKSFVDSAVTKAAAAKPKPVLAASSPGKVGKVSLQGKKVPSFKRS